MSLVSMLLILIIILAMAALYYAVAGYRGQKALKKALGRSDQLSRLVLRSMGEGMYGLDIEGNVTFINNAAGELLGYSPKELMGVKIRSLIEVADEERPRSFGSPRSAAYVSGKHQIEVENDLYRRKDGTTFPVSYTCSILRLSLIHI